MSYMNLARPLGPSQAAPHRASEARCGMAPHRGDVTTVWAAASVRLQQLKRIEKLQAHASSHRTAGTAAVPVVIPGMGRA